MAKSGISVTIKDKGMDDLMARVRSIAAESAAEIGIIEAEDPETAMIARAHELGLGNVPQRSFLRRTIEAGRRRYPNMCKQAFARVLDGSWSMDQALRAVGEEIASDVKVTIMKGVEPVLQGRTVRRKTKLGLPRPKTPLYATGKMYEAIKMRIAKAGG